jgi:nucleotide-binding universal stress UspA family protein
MLEFQPRVEVVMFKHILLPVDGSELCMHAVRLGVQLARTCRSRVFALHVVAPYHAMANVTELLAVGETAYTREAFLHAEHYLLAVQTLADSAGIECRSDSVLNDHPHEAILQTAHAQGCDLIVMASHGWHGVTRLLLGSQTQKVLLESDVPVLVWR